MWPKSTIVSSPTRFWKWAWAQYRPLDYKEGRSLYLSQMIQWCSGQNIPYPDGGRGFDPPSGVFVLSFGRVAAGLAWWWLVRSVVGPHVSLAGLLVR